MPRNVVTRGGGDSLDWSNPAMPSTPMPGDAQTTSGGSSGGRMNLFPSGAQTLGQPTYPWLQSWNGPYAAPMTDMQNKILQHMFDMYGGGAGGGSGSGSSSFSYNPPSIPISGNTDLTYVNQTKDALGKIKDYQDAQALRRIASSAAAGGNALSGARIGAEHDYLGQSGANFESTIGQLMQSALENERNRNNAVNIARIGTGPQYASVNERFREAQMANQLAGTGQLWNAAQLPQEQANRELAGQYADWLRQIGMMRDETRYPDQLAMQMLNGGGYRGQTPNQYGPSQAAGWASLLAALFGNGGQNGFSGSTGGSLLNSLINGVGSLFGGGGGSMSDYVPPESLYNEPVGPNQPDYYNPNMPYDPGQSYDQPIGPTQPGDSYGPWPNDYWWGM